jgi:hypothetical protein
MTRAQCAALGKLNDFIADAIKAGRLDLNAFKGG